MLLSHGKRLRTPGVAAALQSGGACTLFAEAAGAQGLSLPEFSPATKRKLKKALPHFASQNNPLDVTGPGRGRDRHVLRRARGARARPARRARSRSTPSRRGWRARRRGPTRSCGTAVRLRKETGVVVRERGDEPARVQRGGDRVHATLEAAAVPPGASRGARRDRGADRVPGGPERARDRRTCRRIRTGRRRSGCCEGRRVRSTRPRARRLLELYGVRRPDGADRRRPRGRRRRPRARSGSPWPSRRSRRSCRTRRSSAASGSGSTNPTDVEVAAAEVLAGRAARRRGRARVLVQEMVTGTEVLVGAVIDDRVRRHDHDAARAARSPRPARPCSCRARSPRSRRSTSSRAGRRAAGSIRGHHDLRAGGPRGRGDRARGARSARTG